MILFKFNRWIFEFWIVESQNSFLKWIVEKSDWSLTRVTDHWRESNQVITQCSLITDQCTTVLKVLLKVFSKWSTGHWSVLFYVRTLVTNHWHLDCSTCGHSVFLFDVRQRQIWLKKGTLDISFISFVSYKIHKILNFCHLSTGFSLKYWLKSLNPNLYGPHVSFFIECLGTCHRPVQLPP